MNRQQSHSSTHQLSLAFSGHQANIEVCIDQKVVTVLKGRANLSMLFMQKREEISTGYTRLVK